MQLSMNQRVPTTRRRSAMRQRAAIAAGFVVPAVVLLAGGCGGSDTPSESAATGASATATAAMPSGELIAFERSVPGAEERDLYAVGADGGEPRLLNSPGGYPHWSPDGSVLAFNACLDPRTAPLPWRCSTARPATFTDTRCRTQTFSPLAPFGRPRGKSSPARGTARPVPAGTVCTPSALLTAKG